ncbi:MAG: DUF4465 domain-containing protein [Prolixibacteraceae bacterium]
MKSYQFLAQAVMICCVAFTSCKKEDSTVYQTINFESLSVPSVGFWNGSDATGSFTSGKMKFTNQFNTSWQTWSGFAYSQKNDVASKGFENQYSVFDSKNGTNKYALFYPSFDAIIYASFQNNEVHTIQSADLCNSTYAAFSMKIGDAYSKKFGGSTGSDPDWLTVTINGYDANGTKTGSLTFYLADFRFTDSTKDYIVDKWTSVDFSGLGKINKFSIEFASSDSGKYGINTPTYLCLDNIKYAE